LLPNATSRSLAWYETRILALTRRVANRFTNDSK
jgi:hypothetical protein